MQVVYTGETPPEQFNQSLFLAGPSPRSPQDPDWRPKALEILEQLGYDGVVFCPTYREGIREQIGYEGQVAWETRCLDMADRIVFWVPRKLPEVMALTTNVEFGLWVRSGKVSLGYPLDSDKNEYLRDWALREGVAVTHNLAHTLAQTLKTMVSQPRSGAERFLPPELWALDSFVGWYDAHKAAHNRLDDARVLYRLRVGAQKQKTFLWAVWVSVWVDSEKRHKTNESVLFRPDIMSTLCVYLDPHNEWDSKVLMVREFRSTVRNEDCFVRELPGGSTDSKDPKAGAAQELREETGLRISPDRMIPLGESQIVSTLCAYRSGLMGVDLTLGELTELRMRQGEVHGNIADSEMCYLEVVSLRDILQDDRIDWAQRGMILSGVEQLGRRKRDKDLK